jgi:hypothetical protein
MRRFCLAVWLVLASLSVASADHSPFGTITSAVLTDTEAFLLLPPELIAAPVVQQTASSSSGRYLLVARQSMRISLDALREMAQRPDSTPPPLETSLVLWDSRSRTSRTVWRTEEAVSIERLEWLPQASVALVLARRPVPPDPAHPEIQGQTQQLLLSVPGSAENAQVIAQTDAPYEDLLEIHISPARPLALLGRTRYTFTQKPQDDGAVGAQLEPRQTLSTIGADGRVGREIERPANAETVLVEWGADGSPLLRCLTPVPEGRKLLSSWYTVETGTGRTLPLSKEPARYEAKAPRTSALPVRVLAATTTAQEQDTKQAVGLLWLESLVPSRKPRALITGDGADGRLLPDGEAILYTSQGAVWVVPLLRMPKDAYDAMERQAKKAVAISNAKQAGLALLLYAQDFEETLPTGDDINSKLAPYLKNTDPLDGFSYTYPGGKLGDIANPSEAVLGSVSGPGGRAIIYADGHVKWQND